MERFFLLKYKILKDFDTQLNEKVRNSIGIHKNIFLGIQ